MTRVASGLLVMMLAATLGTVVLGEPASGRAAAPTRAAAASSASLRVLTYNIRAATSVDRFDAAVRGVLPYADIVGLQEVNSKPKGARLDKLRAAGWESWREVRTGFHAAPTRGSATQTPVLWRAARFDLVGGSPVRISAPVSLNGELPGKAGNGRWVSVVRLRDRLTGQRLAIVNAHLVQGAVKAGRKVKHRPRTWRLYRAQVAAVASVAAGERARGWQVYLVGDFNSDYVSDAKRRKRALPVRRFRSAGFTSMWAASHPKKGTRGRAFLDQVFAAQRPAANQVLRRIRYSDHLPAVATYVLPVLPGYPSTRPVTPSGPATSPSDQGDPDPGDPDPGQDPGEDPPSEP